MASCNTTATIPFKLLPRVSGNDVVMFSSGDGERWKWKDFKNGACDFKIPKKARKGKPKKFLKKAFEEPKKVCNAAVEKIKKEPIETGLEVVETLAGIGVPEFALEPKITEIKTTVDKEAGCNCALLLTWQCVCCAWIFEWFFCIAVGLDNIAALKLAKMNLYAYATVEDTVIYQYKEKLKKILPKAATKKKLLKNLKWCTNLPPPVKLMSVCIHFKIQELHNQANYKICVSVRLRFMGIPAMKVFSLCDDLNFGGNLPGTRGGNLKLRNIEAGNITLEEGEVFDDELARSLVLFGSSRKIRSIKAMEDPQYEVPWIKEAIKVKERVNWRATNPGETPYLAVLYAHKKKPIASIDETVLKEFPKFDKALKIAETQKWLDNAHHHVFYPGGSCGAAVIQPNKILTICGCVRTFYLANKLKRDMSDIIQEGYDIQTDDIYFQVAEPAFDPDSEFYHLDKNADNFMTESTCVDGIVANASQDYLETLMMVMTFTPEVIEPEKHVMQWPPLRIDELPETAELTTVGVEASDPAWNFVDNADKLVNLEVTAVDYFMKKCVSTYCDDVLNKSTISVEESLATTLKERTSCFCARTAGFQVWNGEVGFPIIADGRLVGLSSTAVDGADDGGLLGTFFDAATIEQVGNYIGSASSIRGIRRNFILRYSHVFVPLFIFPLL